jgi:hypothetical protein
MKPLRDKIRDAFVHLPYEQLEKKPTLHALLVGLCTWPISGSRVEDIACLLWSRARRDPHTLNRISANIGRAQKLLSEASGTDRFDWIPYDRKTKRYFLHKEQLGK